jgi:hypothetical protein
MELDINDRGNLFVPSSRLVPMLQSTLISAAVFFVSSWFNGVDFEEHFPSPAMVIGTLVLGVVTAHLLLSIQANVEFDNSSQQVVKGKKVIVPYHQIRQVELQRGQGDEPGYTIKLRLGASRSIRVLTSNDETGASLDAAEIARTVGKPVALVA